MHHKYIIIALLGASFFPALAAAESRISSSRVSLSQIDFGQPRSVTSHLDVKTMRYLGEGRSYFRDGAAGANTSYILGTKGDLKFSSGVRTAWDLDSEYSSVENWNYFRPHELNVSAGSASSRVWLGQKKFVYSQWEERWNTALFQPRFMDDKLHPTTGGLIGVFAGKDFSAMRVKAGALLLSIPETGPHAAAVDGVLVSKNPWLTPHPTTFQIGGQPTQISYKVDEPDAWSAISKAGVMAQAEYDLSEAILGRTSYAYKPMPQILLGFPVVLQLPSIGLVNLKPRFLYHHVANQDFVLKSGRAEYGLSGAYEHPIKDSLPESWERQNIGDATIASAYATTTMDEVKSWRITGSVLKVWGGDEPDSGPVESKLTLFDRRFQYNEAVSVELRKDWALVALKGLNSGIKLTYDRLQNGLIYSGDAFLRMTEAFAMRFSFDVFDLGRGPSSQPDGFINVYRGNDRVVLGANYDF